MGVAYTSYALNGSKPMTVSIQIDASGNDRKVILAIPVEDTNPFGIAATFDPTGVNVAMTEIADGLLSNTANNLHCRFFYIDESSLPASAGTYTISCTWNGTNNRTLLSVISCNDMATGEPRDVNTNEASAASSITTTITSLSTDTVFDGCGTLDPNAEQTAGTGQTIIIVDTSGPSSSYSTGNTSHSWTDPQTGSWAWFLPVSAWEAASGGTSDAVGSSSGSSVVAGVSAAVADAVGSSLGSAVVAGAAAADADAVGASSGSAVVDGVGSAAISGIGNSVGISTVSGIGHSNADAVGSSSGVAVVLGVGEGTLPGDAVGSSVGTSEVLGIGSFIATISAVGAAAGTSEVLGRSTSTPDADLSLLSIIQEHGSGRISIMGDRGVGVASSVDDDQTSVISLISTR